TAAAGSFELANGLYNMSHYGNGRSIYDTAHSNLSPLLAGDRNSELTLNMDLAEKYYGQAFNLSTNKEFKTKAIFMAAKTEQNRYYNGGRGANEHKYFGMLRSSYSDTQYYQEIIRECGFFRSYLGR